MAKLYHNIHQIFGKSFSPGEFDAAMKIFNAAWGQLEAETPEADADQARENLAKIVIAAVPQGGGDGTALTEKAVRQFRNR